MEKVIILNKGGSMTKQATQPLDEIASLLAKDTLSTKETARILGISSVQVTNEFHEGRLSGWRKTSAQNAALRIYASSVIEFADRFQGRKLIQQSKKSKRG